jgi:hypothetical protein
LVLAARFFIREYKPGAFLNPWLFFPLDHVHVRRHLFWIIDRPDLEIVFTNEHVGHQRLSGLMHGRHSRIEEPVPGSSEVTFRRPNYLTAGTKAIHICPRSAAVEMNPEFTEFDRFDAAIAIEPINVKGFGLHEGQKLPLVYAYLEHLDSLLQLCASLGIFWMLNVKLPRISGAFPFRHIVANAQDKVVIVNTEFILPMRIKGPAPADALYVCLPATLSVP